MPPLGKNFVPTVERSTAEIAESAEIHAKCLEIGAVMEMLAPPLDKGAEQVDSARVYYQHSKLPKNQLMSAFLRRSSNKSHGSYVKLIVRPVYAKTCEDTAVRNSDRKATTENGVTRLYTSFFADGNFESYGHAQKLEYIQQIQDTLQLIATIGQRPTPLPAKKRTWLHGIRRNWQ